LSGKTPRFAIFFSATGGKSTVDAARARGGQQPKIGLGDKFLHSSRTGAELNDEAGRNLALPRMLRLNAPE